MSNNVDDGFGQPKYNGGFAQTFRLKSPRDGERSTTFECRLVPPIKSCRENGKWSVYHGIHFGFLGRDRNNAGKRKNRPFACIQDRDPKTRVVRVECPECVEIEKNLAAITTAEQAGKAQGLSDEQIKLQLAPRYEFKKSRNADRKWHVNIMTPKGDFGTLEISHKCMGQLKTCIEENRDRLGDPMDLNKGYFLVFKRTGRGIGADGVVDVVSVSKMLDKDANGDDVEKVKWAPLTSAQRQQALQVLPDLQHERVTRITTEQISQLIRAKGDPDTIDRIMDAATKREDSPRRDAPAAREAPAAAAPSAPEGPAEQVPAEQAEPEPATASVQRSPATPASDAADFNSMNDDEFVNMFGSNA